MEELASTGISVNFLTGLGTGLPALVSLEKMAKGVISMTAVELPAGIASLDPSLGLRY